MRTTVRLPDDLHPRYRVEPFAGDGLQAGANLDDNAALIDRVELDPGT
jgi:hypothetical protein